MNSIDLAHVFIRLRRIWIDDIRMESSATRIVNHLAYQTIIAMGPPVVRNIILDLIVHGPDHWYHALRQITGENPVPEAHAGMMAAMAQDWVEWYYATGYNKYGVRSE